MILDGIRGRAARRPGATAVREGERTLTYRALVERAERVASAVTGLGVEAGPHAAILAPSGPELAELILGLGAVRVPPALVGRRRRRRRSPTSAATARRGSCSSTGRSRSSSGRPTCRASSASSSSEPSTRS